MRLYYGSPAGGDDRLTKVVFIWLMTVWEIIVFQLPPLQFHRIEFRAIRWQERQCEAEQSPLSALLSDVLTGMDAGAVRYHEGRTRWISVSRQGVEEGHNFLSGRISIDFTVLDFAGREVHAAHQVEPGSDAACFGGRNLHGTPHQAPGVGVGLGQPDRCFVQK